MGWQFWIDRGGTFTDVIGCAPSGEISTHKLLSDNPGQYDDAAIAGIRHLLGLQKNDPLPAQSIDVVKMGTTVGTNALLERRGEPTVLAITEGFADALRIGTQNRPKLFELDIQLPEMLYKKTVEIPERISARGDVIRPLDPGAVQAMLEEVHGNGFSAIAIILMHADRYPNNEVLVANIAREIGFKQISVSHQVIPLMKLIGRGDTTVVDAYVSPILSRYIEQVADNIGGGKLFFMQSNGGLTEADSFRGKDAILSGPAGGVVGLAGIAHAAGFKKAIGFDMGGTSTDVYHHAGTLERSLETIIAGVRLRAPMLNIHPVAAGGGSRLIFDGLRLRVGPESAGSNPGPISYRRGGPLTITDCNVMLGRIQPRHFPHVFGKNADQPLDSVAVHNAFMALTRTVNKQTGTSNSSRDLAEGFMRIAVDNMANAIKRISVQRGHDVTEYTLVCFGGAGGQHACMVADALGMARIMIHPLAGILSAYGMGLADLRSICEGTVEIPLDNPSETHIENAVRDLARAARKDIERQGIPTDMIKVECRINVRYDGTDTALSVPHGTISDMQAAFEDIHLRRFGFIMQERRLIAEAALAEAVGGASDIKKLSVNNLADTAPPKPLETVDMISGGKSYSTPVYNRSALPVGTNIIGPSIIVEANATTVLDPGWQAEVTLENQLVLTRLDPAEERVDVSIAADPVLLEIFNNLFMSVAKQMGAVLQNTAHSVNIKERLDFSCAVFDGHGNLVANAPHMPVHLGSMGESVRAILRERRQDIRPGDSYVLNAPYNGGTHLPDVTVVTPVFETNLGSTKKVFFVASRGHHADIGGITPGSMPPDSTLVDQEGVLLDNVLLVRDQIFRQEELSNLLANSPYPARNIEQNLADLRAQVAANAKGVKELQQMVSDFGLDLVNAYMSYVQDNAEEAVRRVIGKLKSGTFTCEMDDGSRIKVDITVNKQARNATVDFTGTSKQRPNNFNAPSAVCRAAVLYVFRTLVAEDIPLNEGCLKPINIIIPKGSMLAPTYPAAVVAGNVETSQIICDALYAALGISAASQGTMNNLTFGNDRVQYYETVCGGSGAGPDFDGTAAIHTHMTNSRLTDPEVLEWRYPVILERFALRHGSGGSGNHTGGDGVERTIRFNEPMQVAILSGRRTHPPFGLNGGSNGAPGETILERGNGSKVTLAAADKFSVTPGDAITLRTPGGGGYGKA